MRDGVRVFAFTVVICLVCACFGMAFAQEYPTKPITIILPHPPGGTTDIVTRPLANAAKQYLGNATFIFDNRGGGGGTIGPTITATKAPDGYTFGVMTPASIINYYMGKTELDPLKDLVPVVTYTAALQGIVVRADAPWKTMEELITYSKKNPGKVSYGSAGVGTTAHLPIEKLCSDAGMKWKHVPYSGTAEQAPALLGGHIDVLSGSSATWTPLEKGGKFRLLATYGRERSKDYPKTPTLKELGYDVVILFYQQLVAPKGTPAPLVKKVENAFLKAMGDKEWLTLLDRFDMTPLFYLNAEDSLKQNMSDVEYYKGILNTVGLMGKVKK